MTKKQLEARIVELERIVKVLEARPVYQQPLAVPPLPFQHPWVSGGTGNPLPQPPYTITCGLNY